MSDTALTFFVPGVPAPGGSKRGFPIKRKGGGIGVSIVDANKRAKPWMAAVSAAAHEAMNGRPILRGACQVTVTFFMPRPNGHNGKRGLKPSAPVHPTSRPDATKLWRAAEDALRSIVWTDDSQVVRQTVWKEYANSSSGARIIVTPMEPGDITAWGRFA